jgi:uracil-DNA glycosylase family 4
MWILRIWRCATDWSSPGCGLSFPDRVPSSRARCGGGALTARRFDPGCRACPRLAAYLDEIRERYPDYHARPVSAFGDDTPRLLIVGLAPGMHGANRTGRPFTGDYAGILLYETLHQLGLCNRPSGTDAEDGLELLGCRITNAVKCVPPGNKPSTAEIRSCNGFLRAEIDALESDAVLVALGGIAHRAILTALGLSPSRFRFAHGHAHLLEDDRRMVDSYHCSRYNTQTKRLTPQMFKRALKKARDLAFA